MISNDQSCPNIWLLYKSVRICPFLLANFQTFANERDICDRPQQPSSERLLSVWIICRYPGWSIMLGNVECAIILFEIADIRWNYVFCMILICVFLYSSSFRFSFAGHCSDDLRAKGRRSLRRGSRSGGLTLPRHRWKSMSCHKYKHNEGRFSLFRSRHQSFWSWRSHCWKRIFKNRYIHTAISHCLTCLLITKTSTDMAGLF